MKALPSYWQKKLNERVEDHSLRELRVLYGLADFYSNDYLGLARDPAITNVVNITMSGNKDMVNGATGSRLLGGNHIWARRCEFYLAQFYQGENAVLFNSGYNANMGIMACMAGREDTIIYDEYVHASLRDGIRLSLAKSFSFRHNDMADLEKKIEKAVGQVYIVTESVFSMDGDEASLKKITEICKNKKALLILDEAHAVGLYGNDGNGLACEQNIENDCFVRIVTFGKGAGIHGAAAICSDEAKVYLVNFCRPFIYSTALPPHDCIAIMAAHEALKEKEEERKKLHTYTSYFRNEIKKAGISLIEGRGPVCAVLIPGNEAVKKTAAELMKNGMGVFPVLSPTVPVGMERLRVILHSYNTDEEINLLIKTLTLHGK